MTTQANKPVDTLRDGAIKATIWANPSQKGTFYSVEFARTYKSGEAFKESRSFSGAEPLQLARLAAKAYDAIAELRRKDRDVAAVTANDGRQA